MTLNNMFLKVGICACICLGGLASGQAPPIVDNVAVVITGSANADEINNEDLAIWYSIYKGSELYGTKFNFDSKADFGVLFDKQRKVRDTLLPSKTKTLGVEINKVFLKYEELPFDDNSKNQFIEDCSSVARGLKAAID